MWPYLGLPPEELQEGVVFYQIVFPLFFVQIGFEAVLYQLCDKAIVQNVRQCRDLIAMGAA